MFLFPNFIEYSADNSRESSPLQDIVLQSAPGSPGMSLENRNVDNGKLKKDFEGEISNSQ